MEKDFDDELVLTVVGRHRSTEGTTLLVDESDSTVLSKEGIGDMPEEDDKATLDGLDEINGVMLGVDSLMPCF